MVTAFLIGSLIALGIAIVAILGAWVVEHKGGYSDWLIGITLIATSFSIFGFVALLGTWVFGGLFRDMFGG